MNIEYTNFQAWNVANKGSIYYSSYYSNIASISVIQNISHTQIRLVYWHDVRLLYRVHCLPGRQGPQLEGYYFIVMEKVGMPTWKPSNFNPEEYTVQCVVPSWPAWDSCSGFPTLSLGSRGRGSGIHSSKGIRRQYPLLAPKRWPSCRRSVRVERMIKGALLLDFFPLSLPICSRSLLTLFYWL